MQLQREDLVMYVGIAVFVGLIVYDVVSAFKRGALWLPSNYLVQCGLILQLVAVAEVRNVSISRAHQKEQLEKLMAKQLSIDSARLTLCVFMGYLLPGMATTAYRGVWTTIAALLVIRKFFKVDTRLGSLSSGDFHKYKVALESLLMPVDEVVSLWMANEHFYNHVKRRMEEAYEKSASCKELIQVIESCLDKNNLGFFANELVEPLPSVKMYFPALKEPLWSLTVVSLLSIIIEVTPSFDVDHSAVDNAMKAYNQAYSLMKLVDCLDNIYVTVDFFGSANLESFIISKASLVGWNRVNEMYEKRKGKRRATGGAETALTLEAALGIIRKRFEEAEHRLRRNQMLEEVPSTRVLGADWFGMAQSYANYKVYNLILKDENCYSTVDDLRENLFAFLKDVISSCVLQLPHLLLTSSRDWASKFEEEKIYEAAKMVGTVQGVIDAATENRRRGAP
ncbi:hypothetical protein SUGI_0140990 [Cryptomeria japonica]|nr:hypothetical protein SUGI_0140990 [Cryptomeria japonica]